MVDRNLIHSLEDASIDKELGELFDTSLENLHDLDITDLYYPEGGAAEQKYELNEIVEGKIVRVDDDGYALKEGAQVEIGGNERYVSVSRAEFKKVFIGGERIKFLEPVDSETDENDSDNEQGDSSLL